MLGLSVSSSGALIWLRPLPLRGVRAGRAGGAPRNTPGMKTPVPAPCGSGADAARSSASSGRLLRSVKGVFSRELGGPDRRSESDRPPECSLSDGGDRSGGGVRWRCARGVLWGWWLCGVRGVPSRGVAAGVCMWYGERSYGRRLRMGIRCGGGGVTW